MKKVVFLSFVLTILGTSAFCQYQGKITKVYDGETFWVKLNGGDVDSVKLWGIDSPELKQEFGNAALKNLKSLIYKEVNLEYKTRDKDNYMLAIVTYKTRAGEDVNLNYHLVEKGYAWKSKFSKDKKLEKLQKQAEKNKAGLWKSTNPIPPWEWKKHNK